MKTAGSDSTAQDAALTTITDYMKGSSGLTSDADVQNFVNEIDFHGRTFGLTYSNDSTGSSYCNIASYNSQLTSAVQSKIITPARTAYTNAETAWRTGTYTTTLNSKTSTQADGRCDLSTGTTYRTRKDAYDTKLANRDTARANLVSAYGVYNPA